jgi:hypothetical protein
LEEARSKREGEERRRQEAARRMEEQERWRELEETRRREERDAREEQRRQAREELRRRVRGEQEREARGRSEREERRRQAREERRSKPTHYDILGVEASAPPDLIKKCFREKALRFHPDKHATATPEERSCMEGKMKEIAAAHSCLSDPDRRADYDRRLGMGSDSDWSDCSDEEFDFGNVFSYFGFNFMFGRGRSSYFFS